MERYVLRMTRWALSASLAVPCVIWPLWLDFWEQSGKRQAWQGLEAFVEDWPGSGEDQAKEAWWCWERRLHSQMSVGHQRAGRLGVGTLATAGVGSHRSIQLPPSSRSLRPSRNGSPVVPRPPDCLFSRESGSWFLWALLWLLNIGSKNFLNTTWSYKTCLKTGFPPFPPPTHTPYCLQICSLRKCLRTWTLVTERPGFAAIWAKILDISKSVSLSVKWEQK